MVKKHQITEKHVILKRQNIIFTAYFFKNILQSVFKIWSKNIKLQRIPQIYKKI